MIWWILGIIAVLVTAIFLYQLIAGADESRKERKPTDVTKSNDMKARKDD